MSLSEEHLEVIRKVKQDMERTYDIVMSWECEYTNILSEEEELALIDVCFELSTGAEELIRALTILERRVAD